MKVCFQDKKDTNPCSKTYNKVQRFSVPCPPGIICKGKTGTETADLSLMLTGDKSTVTPGDIVVLSLRFNNQGPNIPNSVEIRGTLPQGLEFVDSLSGISYSPNTRTLSKTLVNPVVGQQVFELRVKVIQLSSGTLRTLFEIYSSSLPDPDSTPGNGMAGEDDTTYHDLVVQVTQTTIPVNQTCYRLDEYREAGKGVVNFRITLSNPKNEDYLVMINYLLRSPTKQPRAYTSFTIRSGQSIGNSGYVIDGENGVEISDVRIQGVSSKTLIQACSL